MGIGNVANVALATESAIRPDVEVVAADSRVVGKTLLTRPASVPFATHVLSVLPCNTEQLWSRYERCRLPVELDFGLSEVEARALIRETRQRTCRLPMTLWLAAAPDSDALVGAIAALTKQDATLRAARLQEVDVFPDHRGQGLGVALLEAARRELLREHVDLLVIGADEDDWPLAWYQRLGFRPALRVSKSGA